MSGKRVIAMTGTSDVFVAPVGWRQSSAEATRADDTEQLKQNRGVEIAQENQNEAVRSAADELTNTAAKPNVTPIKMSALSCTQSLRTLLQP